MKLDKQSCSYVIYFAKPFDGNSHSKLMIKSIVLSFLKMLCPGQSILNGTIYVRVNRTFLMTRPFSSYVTNPKKLESNGLL